MRSYRTCYDPIQNHDSDNFDHDVHFLESFTPTSLVVALADEHDVSGIRVLVVVPRWWRRKTFPPLILALPVIAVPVFAPSVISPPVITSGFVWGRRRISPFVRWRPWSAEVALPHGVVCRPVSMIPARPIEQRLVVVPRPRPAHVAASSHSVVEIGRAHV